MNLNHFLVQRGEKSSLVSFETRSWQAKIPSKSGKFMFSIVAGESLYSRPRQFMEQPNYSEMEVGIFSTERNNWATYEEVKPVFPAIGEGEAESGQPVFPYVDVKKIVEAIDLL